MKAPRFEPGILPISYIVSSAKQEKASLEAFVIFGAKPLLQLSPEIPGSACPIQETDSKPKGSFSSQTVRTTGRVARLHHFVPTATSWSNFPRQSGHMP